MRGCWLVALAACTTHPGEPQPGPSTVTLTLRDRPDDAARFAFVVAIRDGDESWALAPAPAGDVYTFAVTAERYAVGWTCAPTRAGAREMNLVYATVGEHASLAFEIEPWCTDRAASAILTGTVADAGSEPVLVQFGGRVGFTDPSSGRYDMPVFAGTHDLVALRTIAGTTRAVVRRDVGVANTTTVDLDFSASLPTQARAFSITAPPGAQVVGGNLLHTGRDVVALTNPEAPIFLDDSQLAPGAYYDQQVTITSGSTTNRITRTFSSPADQSYTVRPVLGTIDEPEIGTWTWPAYPDVVAYAWQALMMDSSKPPNQCGVDGACSIVWSALISPGAAGTVPSFTLPDLSALPSWSPLLTFWPYSQRNGTITAITSSAGAEDFSATISSSPLDVERTFASRGWFDRTPR